MTDDATLSRRAFLLTAAGTAAAGTAAAQTDGEGTETENGGGGTGDGGGGGGGDGTETDGGDGGGGGGTVSETVAVGPDNELVFEPASVQVTPGSEVTWVWESDTHNVVVDSQPEDASWEGHEPIEDSGFEYSHTFDALGTYEYHCEPHLSAGMEGVVEVVESIETPAPAGPAVPESAKALGVATTFAMVATLGLAFFFLKYGGDYGAEE